MNPATAEPECLKSILKNANPLLAASQEEMTCQRSKIDCLTPIGSLISESRFLVDGNHWMKSHEAGKKDSGERSGGSTGSRT